MPAVFVSGGIGGTPFRSMLNYAAGKQLPVKIGFVGSNRNTNNVCYLTKT